MTDIKPGGKKKKINETRVLKSCFADFCGKVYTRGPVLCWQHVCDHKAVPAMRAPQHAQGAAGADALEKRLLL